MISEIETKSQEASVTKEIVSLYRAVPSEYLTFQLEANKQGFHPGTGDNRSRKVQVGSWISGWGRDWERMNHESTISFHSKTRTVTTSK